MVELMHALRLLNGRRPRAHGNTGYSHHNFQVYQDQPRLLWTAGVRVNFFAVVVS